MSTLRRTHKSIYWAWKAMKQRCQNLNCSAFSNYGARGITVCEEWQSFEPFLEWSLQSGYQKGLDLDRIDNNAGYSPDNCRWVTRRENINNRRKTTLLTVNGETKPRTYWEDICGIPRGTVKAWVITNGSDYAAERIAEALKSGYVKKDYSRNHNKTPVRCIETGQIFPSYYDAAKSIGANRGALVGSVRRQGSCKGLHFELVTN